VRKLSGLANIVVRIMSAFKEAQIEQLVSSGWSTCDHIAGLVQERGPPAISRGTWPALFPPLSGYARRRLWEH
jgi:hypothetical protein